jgi:uncharacterized membrane protein
MGTSRIEAFSDGVIAVIITITVLDLKMPNDASLETLLQLRALFLTYLLSFIVVAIMWVNHHHMMHLAKHASAKLLWANNNLLFWMSLIPFTTAYLGHHISSPVAVATYGTVLTLCAFSFTLLRHVVNQFHLDDVGLTRHNTRIFRKSLASSFLYMLAIPLAYLSVRWSFAIFTFVPAAYFLPERGITQARK